jgi:hypothetical protein
MLNRNNLDKIYVAYMLPLLEYVCELCDGCCSRDADKLEQLQFEAARIITIQFFGGLKSTSTII